MAAIGILDIRMPPVIRNSQKATQKPRNLIEFLSQWSISGTMQQSGFQESVSPTFLNYSKA
jgi:hypothetical protein